MILHSVLVAIILGIVEGATEFIPVSSTGHLILVSEWLAFTGRQADVFAVFIQLGAILAVVWLYRTTMSSALREARRSPVARRFLRNIVIGTIPAAAVGFLARDLIMTHLFDPLTVGGALVVGGIAIILIEWWGPRTPVESVDDVPTRTALGVGLAQVLALFPGVSRSAATIMGGYALGLTRRTATEFSFFLAIPIMLAASAYELLGAWTAMTPEDVLVLGVGFVTSFLAALVVVQALVRFVSMHTFKLFAWYRIGLGCALVVYYGFLT